MTRSCNVGYAAVGLNRHGLVGYHAGIVYRTDDSEPKVLHLAWHHVLSNDDVSDDWTWVAPDVDPIDLMHVANVCDLVFSSPEKDRIPYGFSFGTSHVDESGAIIIGKSDLGLTCATFVIAIFRRARVELLDVETWQHRESDAAAQKILIDEMGRRNPHHAAAMRAEGRCVRYRTEEVAAASAVGPRPLQFDSAESIGRGVLATLSTVFPQGS